MDHGDCNWQSWRWKTSGQGSICQYCLAWTALCQINSILSIMPNVLPSKDELMKVLQGGKDLGNGYALLWACQSMAINVSDWEASAIMALWDEKGWPNQDQWPCAVRCWACLCLPNGQVVQSHWMECQSQRNCKTPELSRYRNPLCFFTDLLIFKCRFWSLPKYFLNHNWVPFLSLFPKSQ